MAKFAAICTLLVIASAMVSANRVSLQHNHLSIEHVRAQAQARAVAMHMHAAKRGLQPKGARVAAPPVEPMYNGIASGMYAGIVQVGTPAQNFSCVMDTGSSNLWVPDSSCTDYTKSPSCKIQNKFDANASSTYVEKCDLLFGCALDLPYGSGTVYGTLSIDTVSVGGFKLPTTTFGRVTQEPGPLSEWGAPLFDGIMGLAYPIIAMPMLSFLPGPFDEMMTRKLVPEDLFSIHLSSIANDTSSYVAFGEIPTTDYEGNLTTVPQDKMQPELGYWCVSVNAIKVGGVVQPSTSGIIGVVDTGTSLIAGPPDVVNPIIAQVNATSNCSNVDHLPKLAFNIQLENNETMDFVLTPQQYTYRVSFKDGTPDQCACGLFAFAAGEGLLPLWILGDPFIRSYFTVFNRGDNKVQFAPTKYSK